MATSSRTSQPQDDLERGPIKPQLPSYSQVTSERTPLLLGSAQHQPQQAGPQQQQQPSANVNIVYNQQQQPQLQPQVQQQQHQGRHDPSELINNPPIPDCCTGIKLMCCTVFHAVYYTALFLMVIFSVICLFTIFGLVLSALGRWLDDGTGHP